MTKETAELIQDAYNELTDSEEGGLRHHPVYSGRGMFGKTTHAISGDRGMIIRCVVLAALHIGENGGAGKPDGDEFAIEMGGLRWDNLGRDEICY